MIRRVTPCGVKLVAMKTPTALFVAKGILLYAVIYLLAVEPFDRL
jgi:hypothetical protein